jgi:two-component system, NtrC family, nitrogen regulation sensor histidine kinase NtrY
VQRRTRYVVLIFSTVILCVIAWLAIFFQRKPYLIGGGVNRIFLFLLINAHLLVSIVLLYLILRQSIKLYIERRRQEPGSAFKRNLFFAFIVFSVIPVVFVFFIAGNIITRSIDNWFQARIGIGLESGVRIHEERTKRERSRLLQAGEVIEKSLSKEGLPRGGESFQEVIKAKINVLQKNHREFSDYSLDRFEMKLQFGEVLEDSMIGLQRV